MVRCLREVEIRVGVAVVGNGSGRSDARRGVGLTQALSAWSLCGGCLVIGWEAILEVVDELLENET